MGEERKEQQWDEVPGRQSMPLLGSSILFMIFSCAAFLMAVYTRARDDGDGTDRLDAFRPGRVALKTRWWKDYNLQFQPTGPAQWYLPFRSQSNPGFQPIAITDNARRAVCIAKETGEPSIEWPDVSLFTEQQDCRAWQTRADEANLHGKDRYIWDNLWANNRTALRFTGMDDQPGHIECRFEVPYPAVFGAMSASLFGLGIVCLQAFIVLKAPRGSEQMSEISDTIHKAALSFLKQEYTWLLPFVMMLWLFLFIAIDGQENGWYPAASVSFLIGAALSAACGFFGMSIATEGNCRTAAACYSSRENGVENGLRLAFRTGACMGIAVVSCGVFGLTICYACFGNVQALSGFGFGSSAVALFARVGGGIYTKAADVGADLCGKVDAGLAEDSPKNPATIADCVGDNVGDVAGMGADLFESFVGSVVAACVLGAPEFGTNGVALPFFIVLIGLVVCVVCSSTISVQSSGGPGTTPSLDDLLAAMRRNVLAAAAIITTLLLILCVLLFESESQYLHDLNDKDGWANYNTYPQIMHPEVHYRELRAVPFNQQNPGYRIFGAILVGLVAGILIGMATEYFTSHTDVPTQSIAEASEYGPGPVIIQGLGMGSYSTVIPLVLIIAAVLGAYYFAGFYGTAVACVGMLSTLGVTMSTDAYGPVSDNAGGIAEMCELPSWVREYTDALDALGNTTAATGKGFANGSAVLSAISTLTAFARSAEIEEVDLMRPVVVMGVLIGALLPYLFAAMTMLSVNKAAKEMMGEVRRQFLADPLILTHPDHKPDHAQCIAISCRSSLREMIMPGVLAVFSPLIMGFTFGSHCLVGLLIGSIASGYLLGVMMSNTGGAWDNAKKYVEAGELVIDGKVQGKGTDCHKAAVCGDTVGDPFKDTSGPALNILIKLMTRFAFVLAPLFDPSFHFWWVGIILLFVATVVVGIVYFVFLREVEEKVPRRAPDSDDE